MELSIFLLMVACLASCGLVTGGGKKESEWKRLTGLEKGLQDLTKEMKNIKAFCRSAVQPTDGSASTQLAKDTLAALEMESRALSQFDVQMRSLQSSLEQLSRNKDQHADVIQSFRRELHLLKNDVDSMKERNDDEPDATLSPQSENAAKTLHWLLKSVSSLKSDVNQINRNINVTRAFQQSEEVQKKMHLLQGEVNQLRHQWTEESVERQRLSAEIIQMRIDLEDSTGNHKRCLKDLGDLSKEVQLLKADWNISVDFGGRRSSSRSSHWNHKFDELKHVLRSVRDKQHHLEEKVNRMKPSSMTDFDDTTSHFSELEAKVLVNFATLAKLEASHDTIRENVLLISEQGDLKVKEMQLAVDQIRFNVSQMFVNYENTLQHQNIVDDKLSRIANDVEVMEGEMERGKLTILTLQNHAMNDTLQKCKQETNQQIQDMKIHAFQYQIDELKIKVQALDKTLEYWESYLLPESLNSTLATDSSTDEEIQDPNCGDDC